MAEMPTRLQIFYQDVLTNIAFIKQQEWAVTRYTFAA